MARTAPVPNIPPIPGMCPSVAVLAGGGSAGSGSGGSGSGGSGDAGAGTSSGQNDAESDSRSAPAGQQGSAAQACPIDVVTGVMFTTVVSDFWLPGPLAVDWRRGYRTSAAERTCGIGYGWSHPYAWRAEQRRKELVVIDDEGTETPFPLLVEAETARAPFGRSLTRHRNELVLATNDGLRRILREHAPGKYQLAAVRDRAGNEVRVEWEAGEVRAVFDSVGRRAERKREGNRIVWTAVAADAQGREWTKHLCTYEIDARGDLVRVTDAAGAATVYTYDDEHYLVAERRPDGLTWRFRYEETGKLRRCLETWGELEGRDILAELGAPEPPKGTPRPRGIFHTRFEYGPGPFETTVVDGIGAVHRYFGNALGLVAKYVDPGSHVTSLEYDEMGNVLATRDGLGNVEQCSYDADGRIASYTDVLGSVTAFERDERGDLVGIVDAAGGAWRMRYDARGKLLDRIDPGGALTQFAYDERGLRVQVTGPTGASDRMTYDAHGNLVELATARGAVWRYGWDLFGLPVSIVTPTGAEYRLRCDARGDIVAVDGPHGQSMRLEPDAMRRPLTTVHPSGAATTFRYVADALVEKTYPDGSRFRMRFDALLRCRAIENAAGEVRTLEYDLSGNLVREVGFDGRVFEYKHDANGRCIAVKRPDGTKEALTLDPAGRIVAKEHPNGATHAFEFDRLGRLVRAAGPGVEVEFELDACGRVLKEIQRAADREFVVERSYDTAGRLVETRYSTGWSVSTRRDGYSLVEAMRVVDALAGEDELRFEYDPVGREQRRARTQKPHAIETERDLLGRPVRMRIVGDGGRPIRERAWTWALSGPVERVTDSEHGTRVYELDAVGRPLQIEGLGAKEGFRYSWQGAPLPSNRQRELERGGRIVKDGDVTLRWDAAGRLAERIHADPSKSWTYRYGEGDWLSEAKSGTEEVLKFVYDPFGRRLAMQHGRTTTWFGWEGERLVDERTSDGGAVLRVYADDGVVPLLESTGGPWKMIATDSAATPWFLLGADGRTAEIDLTTWGQVARESGESTLLRFAGQRADLATGLAYNKQRYYAPDLGIFITPDPLGADASPFELGFVPNPTLYIDPLGLIIVVTSNDPQRWQTAQARGAASGQRVIHHSSLGPGGTETLRGESHVEIVTHGAPGGLELGNRLVSGREMGEFLNNAGFSGDTIDLRTVCNAGTRPNYIGTPAAQELADTTQATVQNAATTGWNPLNRRQGGAISWTYTSGPQAGQTFIAGITTQQTPTGPRQVPGRRQGHYATFNPRPPF